MEPPGRRRDLTRREKEVLAWVAEGKTNAEIGLILEARPRTVAKHLERIFQKLGVESRTAAARVALDSRLALAGGRTGVPGEQREERPEDGEGGARARAS